LYVRDKVGSITRPVKELKGFRRITLRPGEQQTVEFKLAADDLAFWHPDLKKYWEPGEFVVMIGTSSAETLSETVTVN